MRRLTDIDIKYLKGVGPKRADTLGKELDIHTYYDLLHYFPSRYDDRSKVVKIKDVASDNSAIQVRGRFIVINTVGEGARRRVQGLFSDGTGTLDVVWFNRLKYVQDTYRVGVDYLLFGKMSIFNGRISLVHPEIDPGDTIVDNQGLQAQYSIPEKLKTRGFTQRSLRQLISTLLASMPAVEETLPPELLRHYGLMPLREALECVHFPKTREQADRARARFKFEELFLIQLNILSYSRNRKANIAGYTFPRIGTFFNRFYSDVLPFSLTEAQKKVMREIRADLGSGRQMNRLLQGDVGSGKTIVALMTSLIAVDNGYQACIMAPTEILACQHYESLSAMAGKIGVRVELLTGSTTKKKRDELHASLLDGTIHILVGTHAVIEDCVEFRRLGLVVIDEQHRFGVAQRAKLWNKSTSAPHVLVMTATPIPRTLAMTVYGDLDVSVIDALPPGRKPIMTMLQYENRRREVNSLILGQLKAGRQVYIVYPLIQENEKLELKDLLQGLDATRMAFPGYEVGMVHGKMRPVEKDEQMQMFVSGKTRILVATTVIEVGVNVPNASVMVIENAERFGLSQLHQLRGRVGRGADQSYCILMTKPNIAADTRKRLEIMVETTDGFVIADADMKLRGPGDIEGTMQSGIAFNLRIANLASDSDVLAVARQAATMILDSDPLLERHYSLREQLRIHFNKTAGWSRIS